MRHRLIPALAAACLVLAAGACSDDGGPERDDDGAIVEGDDLGAFDMEVGDCFNDPEGMELGTQSTVLQLPAVPCGDPHDNEVFALIDLEDGDYPGVEDVSEEGFMRCMDEFEGYVGAAYDETDLIFDPYLYPTEQTWEAGDREVVCALYNADLSKLTGSMAESAG